MRTLWLATFLVACSPMEPSGNPLEPVAPAASVASVATPGASAPLDDPELDEIFDERPDEEPGAGDLTAAQIAGGLGASIAPLASGTPAEAVPSPTPTASGLPPIVPPPAMPPVQVVRTTGWTPDTPLDGSWGVRLVSTVVDASPPRAILGLPDGSEEVVQAGTLLPDTGVVVLAIGRDIVQVAEILPRGDHARVQTRTLSALYPRTP